MTQFSFKHIIGLLLLLSSSIAYGATLTSSVDRNPIKINQTLTLTVKFDEQVNTSQLDLSELAEDFKVLATIPSSNSSVSILNGQTTRLSTTTWRINLTAKRAGSLTIPAFKINGVSSTPITIQVSNLSAAELAEPQPVDVTVTIDDADNLSIKPGEQIIINVELSAADDVGNLRGEELRIDGADVEALGQQNGQRLENGVARQVAIWRYAIFPAASGQIDVPAQTFTGTIGGRSRFFDSFISGGQQVGGRSVAQTINVEPQPEKSANTWFPANNVSIESAWSGDINQVRVGEPITRTITITATGQRATAIPPLRSDSPTDYKSYRDQPQLETSSSAQGVIGVRVESEAIVPSSSGELSLPEQRISWWDSRLDQWNEAVLPAQTITVLAALGGTIAEQNKQNFTLNSGADNDLSNQPNSYNQLSAVSGWWWKLATVCLALICLLQFYFLRRQAIVHLTEKPATNDSSLNETVTWKQLQQALNSGDVKTIRKDLLTWADSAMPEQTIQSLDDVSGLSNSDTLKDQLNQLDKHIYSHGEAINIEQLSVQISELRGEFKARNKQQKTASGELAPLYPA